MNIKTIQSLAPQAFSHHLEYFLKNQFLEEGSLEAKNAFGQVSYIVGSYLDKQDLKEETLFLISLSLIPHIAPNLLDQLFEELFGEGDFPQLGGVRGKQHRGILPTGETALFLLAKDDVEQRAHIIKKYLSPNHWLFREQILYLEAPLSGEPRLSGKLLIHPEFVELFTTGEVSPPPFSMDFPAERISTRQEWSDLVLHPFALQQIQNLEHWLEYGDRLLEDWEMGRKFKPGYRVLFYGPPGTGKTLTASLLGKHTGRDVYRVDLSMIVSKYIGETEKNLSKLFDKAEHKDWILFFDEADALFGKRTGVRDSHDRYANQEISYLLQRVETYNGLVVLASNFKKNIDKAFLRRFQAVVHFSMPRPGERLLLWQRAVPPAVTLAEDVKLKSLADRYELSGADIINIMHYCCLKVMAKGHETLSKKLLLEGIGRELLKLEKGI